jgi:hypothetical protein
MKTALVLLVSAFLMLPACEGRAPDTTRAASEDAAAPDLRRSEYAEGIETRLDNFKQKLDQLENRMDDLGGQARWDVRNRLAKFRWESQSIERKLNDMIDATAESWTDIKSDIDERLAELEREFEDLLSTHRINIE